MGVVTYDFSGRSVIVTGGSRGVGLAIAHAFADAGANVTVTGTQFLTALYDEDLSRFQYQQLQLASTDSVSAFAERCHRVDVLVNSAGARLPKLADEAEREFTAHAARLGLIGPAQLTTRLRYRLSKSTSEGGGAVVNTPLLRTWLTLAYGTTENDDVLGALTRRLATSCATSGVRVNSIDAPVVVPAQTGGFRVQIDRNSGPLLTRLKAPRTVEDIVSLSLYLASVGSTGLTGQTLSVRGVPRRRDAWFLDS